MPEKFCSHQMLEQVGWRSDTDSPPGKPLQHFHRQGITEPPIQFIPIIQQRPLVAFGGKTGNVENRGRCRIAGKLCSHGMLEEVGWRSDIDPPPGKPLQHLHRQRITEPPTQFIPIIQQRPLVAQCSCTSQRRASITLRIHYNLKFSLLFLTDSGGRLQP